MITPTSTGKLNHAEFRVLLATPSWLTEVQAGTGVISYTTSPSDGLYIDAPAVNDDAFLVTTDDRDDYKTNGAVVRVYAKINSVGTTRRIWGAWDAAARPNAGSLGTAPREPNHLRYYAAPDYGWRGQYVATNYYSTLGGANNTYYIWETYWNPTDSNVYLTARNASTLAVLGSGNGAWAYADSIWLWIGDADRNSIHRNLYYRYIQEYLSNNITITGVPTDSAAGIYNSSGTLISSANESGGNIVIDASLCDFNSNPDLATGGFYGYIILYADSGLTDIIDRYDSTMFWGGDEYAYSYSTPAIARRESKHFYIAISSADGSEGLTMLNETSPDGTGNRDLFTGLSFESCNPGGFTVANFTVRRDPRLWWPDLKTYNRISIGGGSQRYWEGYIDKPDRQMGFDEVQVGCLGWSSQLNELGATADVYATTATYKASTFITGVMLADTDIDIVAGTVETGDYAYPIGTKWTLAPYTEYYQCMEQFNSGNNYDWGVWLDLAFDYADKDTTTIDWFVKVGDCDDIRVAYNPEQYCNRVIVSYTQDGSHNQTVTVNNTTEQSKYGRVVTHLVTLPGRITTAGATQVANTYLAEHEVLRVSAEFTTTRVYTINGTEGDLALVRAGENVRILDWIPTQELLGYGVSDISTFQIKRTLYNRDDKTLDITPTEFISSVDITISRLQTGGYLR